MISTLAKQLFDDVAQHLPKSAGGVSAAFSEPLSEKGSEAFSQFKVHIEATLRKMNLVSRDEFDAQTAVLQKTHKRLEALEKQIEAVEGSLKHSPKES